jgi:hypothetical protein
MAIIDTLKLARALHEKGGFTQDAADATAEALNESFAEGAATRADLAQLGTELRGKIAAIDGKLTVLIWAVGINVAATITMLVKHW